MVSITVDYEGQLHCTAKHEPSSAVLSTDAPLDNHGRGESFSPTDLCATALASCMATVMAIKATSMNINLAGMKLKVDKIMSTDSPRRIAQLPVEIWLPVPLEEPQQESLKRAALHCPVHQSLHPDIEKPITFHWK